MTGTSTRIPGDFLCSANINHSALKLKSPFTPERLQTAMGKWTMNLRRPALVLPQDTNFGNKIGHSILAMITSRKNDPWPVDCEIKNKKLSGLKAPSVVRMKRFTLDNRFIMRKISHLSKNVQKQAKLRFSQIFDYLSFSIQCVSA